MDDRFSVLAESSLAGIYLVQDGVFRYVNPALAAMFGYTVAELADRLGPVDLAYPEDRPIVAENLRRRIEGETDDIRYRLRGLRKDGSVFPIEVHGRRIRQQGKVGVMGTLLDDSERQRVEEELRRTNARLEEAQRIAHVGWWERDYETSRVRLSDEACRIFGVQPVDLPNWHGRWLDLIHLEDRERAAEASAIALRGGPRYDVEYRIVRSDGSIRVVHSHGDVIWDDSGRLIRQFGVMQDVTELRQAERALRASETRFRTFVDHAWDAFFLHDERGTILDVNRQACESLGYGRDELIGATPRSFDVDLDEASAERLRQRIGAGEISTFETRHRRKDGSTFPVEVRTGRFEQGGRRFLSLARDITARKRAEERRLLQHAVTRILTEAASVEEAAPRILKAVCECLEWDLAALWRIDSQAGMLRCTELWRADNAETVRFEALTRAMTFLPGSGLPGQVWTSGKPAFVPDVVHDASFVRGEAAARDGLHGAFAFPILLDNQVLGVIDVVSRRVRQPDQELLDSFATLGSQIGQFIERKRVQHALQMKQAELVHVARVTAMGELTASIAHEVKQPIAAAVSYARAALHCLNRGPPDVEKAQQALLRIVNEGLRAAGIIDRIRALIRKAPPQKAPVELNGAIREVVELIGGEAVKRGVSMRTDLADRLPPVVGDRVELQQVVLNLVINALEALGGVADREREVLISTRKHASGGVLVAVRDWGPGLDQQFADRMFEAFCSTKANGMGMGLAICRSIIESHGGRLWAGANEPYGAVFQFMLPVVPGGMIESGRSAPRVPVASGW
ncbi:MAG: PAS domain S-box protein [Acetobacteraceae bacterium]|nr:PAS domain S-box protein [Acetobacteraceae bacterium]